MKSIFVVLLAAFLFSSPDARGAECETRDLRKRMGPILNQQDLGWCAAYAVSDYLSFISGQRISASAMGLGVDSDVGARPVDLLNLAMTNGVCLEKQFSLESAVDPKNANKAPTLKKAFDNAIGEVERDSQDIALTIKMRRSLDLTYQKKSEIEKQIENQNFVQSWWKSKDNLKEKAFWNREVQLSREDWEDQAQQLCKIKSDAPVSRSLYMPMLTVLDRIQILEDRVGGDNIRLTALSDGYALGRRLCQPPTKIKGDYRVMSDRAYEGRPKTSLLQSLNNVLDKHKPVVISYHISKFLSEGDSYDANHASTIIGRRPNPQSGKCEYLIRNTWGPSCLSNVPGKEKESRYKYPCEAGHIWVPEAALTESLTAVSYLD